MLPFSLKILIVEDNLSFAIELEMLLEELNYNVLATVDNSTDALQVIYRERPDLIFMDINIKGDLSGIEIGHKIEHLKIPILYITSLGNQEHYEAVQQSNMIGYMVKPVGKISLKTAIQLSISKAYTLKNQKTNTARIENNIVHDNFFFFKEEVTFHKVHLREIAFIKSNDNYCQSHTRSGQTFMARISISQLEKMLPPKLFMRIHRQYIVQIPCIETVSFISNALKIGGEVIPISRSKRKALTTMLKMLS